MIEPRARCAVRRTRLRPVPGLGGSISAEARRHLQPNARRTRPGAVAADSGIERRGVDATCPRLESARLARQPPRTATAGLGRPQLARAGGHPRTEPIRAQCRPMASHLRCQRNAPPVRRRERHADRARPVPQRTPAPFAAAPDHHGVVGRMDARNPPRRPRPGRRHPCTRALALAIASEQANRFGAVGVVCARGAHRRRLPPAWPAIVGRGRIARGEPEAAARQEAAAGQRPRRAGPGEFVIDCVRDAVPGQVQPSLCRRYAGIPRRPLHRRCATHRLAAPTTSHASPGLAPSDPRPGIAPA